MKRNQIITIGIVIAICIIFVSVLCFIITQRWVGSVNIDETSVAVLNQLQDIKKSESLEFNKKLFDTILGKESENSSVNHREKTYETAEFQRKASLEIDDSGSKIVLNYSFNDMPFAACEVCISTDSASNLTYSSVEELKETLSEEIVFNKYMYNKYAVQGTTDGVNYYISPITTPPRTGCFYLFATDKNERVIDSVYEIGEYFVSIHEYLPPNGQVNHQIVLQDLGALLDNQQSGDGSLIGIV